MNINHDADKYCYRNLKSIICCFFIRNLVHSILQRVLCACVCVSACVFIHLIKCEDTWSVMVFYSNTCIIVFPCCISLLPYRCLSPGDCIIITHLEVNVFHLLISLSFSSFQYNKMQLNQKSVSSFFNRLRVPRRTYHKENYHKA